jgi:acid phosphatase type 7
MKKISPILSTVLLALLSLTASASKDTIVAGLLLTWVEDPSTTMVIDVHTLKGYSGKTSLSYRQEGDDRWKLKSGTQLNYPFRQKTINRFSLQKLNPARRYEFVFGDDTVIYRFRTMPGNIKHSDVTFIAGGDTMHDKLFMDKTNKVALRYDPDFIVLGGDLAYANGLASNTHRWDQWFRSIQEHLVDKENRIVPLVIGIGNHEVLNGSYTKHPGFEDTPEWKHKIAPFFFDFFAFPGIQGYNVLDFGKYLSLIALDTNHANPIAGKQTVWLEKTLTERRKTNFVVPFYHVPAYPSVRPYSGGASKLVRDHFVPLFEANGVKLVFENHDHAYKRTYPIFKNKIDSTGKGITYVGDGAWGVNTRPTNAQEWYLKQSRDVRHFIVVTLNKKTAQLRMVDENGLVFDQCEVKSGK